MIVLKLAMSAPNLTWVAQTQLTHRALFVAVGSQDTKLASWGGTKVIVSPRSMTQSPVDSPWKPDTPKCPPQNDHDDQ